jgi:hypothetical protein
LFFDTTNIHAPSGIRTQNLSSRAAEDPSPRPLGHWDQPENRMRISAIIYSFHCINVPGNLGYQSNTAAAHFKTCVIRLHYSCQIEYQREFFLVLVDIYNECEDLSHNNEILSLPFQKLLWLFW